MRRFKMTFWSMLWTTAALLVLAACSSGSGTGTPHGTPGDELRQPEFELRKQAALTSFDACLDMEAYLSDLAVAELLRGTSGGGYDYGGGGSVDAGGWGVPTPAADVAMAAADAGSWSGGGDAAGGSGGSGGGSSSPDQPADWTGTNNQTDGVDEADFVKTDGAYVYAVSGRSLRIIDAWPPEETAEVGALTLPHAPFEMFVRGDTALLFSRLSRGELPDDMGEAIRADRAVSQFLLMTFVDLTDRTDPTIVRTLHVEGGYVSARMVDGAAFVVARSSVNLDRSSGWDIAQPWDSGRPDTGNVPGVADAGGGWTSVDVQPTDPWDAGEPPPPDAGSWGGWDVGEPPPMDVSMDEDTTEPPQGDGFFAKRSSPLTADEARAAVGTIVNGRTADDWLPRYRDEIVLPSGSTEVDAGLIVACDDVYRPATPFGQDLLVVLSLDLDSPLTAHAAQAVIGGAETIYASSGALYVAASKDNYWYYEDLTAEERGQTAIHKFALDGGVPQYRASADVAGRLLNQFSLDEFDGHLRVATTTGQRWSDQELESHVLVLGERAGRLEETGRIDGLGSGEDIYAVRFVGDRGFVVTFRQVDPLFTLDLSDPTAPAQVGELEIPGFSTYLHPMDEDHLLAIGESRSGEIGGEWFEEEWGVKLAIYDVSDLAHPREVKKTVIADAASEAQYDHRAFTYYAAQGVLAVPFQRWEWEWETQNQGLLVWDVSVEDGFEERGEVNHSGMMDALVAALPADLGCWGLPQSWSDAEGEGDGEVTYHAPAPPIRRSLFLDDYLYTVSTAGLQVNPLADLATTTASVPFGDVCALRDWCETPSECWEGEGDGWYMP